MHQLTLRDANHKEIMRLEIRGTTLSGNPISTTFGNTMRSFYYNAYELYKLDGQYPKFGYPW